MTNPTATVPQQPQPKPVDLNLKLICRDCKEMPPKIVEDFAAGDLVCGSCGLVLGNRIIDTRSEWRTFSNDEGGDDPSRVGGPSDGLRDSLEATQISGKDGGSGQAKELNKAHRRAVAAKGERELLHAFREIQTMGDRIGLSKAIIEPAKHLFKKAHDLGLTKSKSPNGFIASCVYVACRERHVERTFKEIGALGKVSKKEMGKCYKLMKQEGLLGEPMQLSADAHISRFSSHLQLSKEVVNTTRAIAERAQKLGTLEGRSPITFVASCIYFVVLLLRSNGNIKDIAEVAGCVESTVKNAYKLLLMVKDKLIGGDPKLEPLAGNLLMF